MILLAATTDKIQLITSAAATVDVHASYIDASSSTLVPSGGGKQNTAITTAATTDILAAPGASTLRNMKTLTVRNKHTTVTTDVTVQYNQNATLFELFKTTLAPGQVLEFTDELGFYVLAAATGQVRLFKTADSTFSVTTLADIAELSSFTLAANSIYRFKGTLFVSSNATTVGIHHGVNFSGTVTSLRVGSQNVPVTAETAGGSAIAFGYSATSNEILIATTAGPGTAPVLIVVEGTIEVGASGGAFSFRQASETATVTTCLRGSFAEVEKIG